jgi:hypothetical protein
MKTNKRPDHKVLQRKQFIALVMKRVQPGTGSGLDFLERRTYMQPVTNLKAIIKKTPFVIVGGLATRLYMPERLTLDLDILVLTQKAPQLYQELEQAGSKRLGMLNIEGTQWQLPDATSLYVLETQENWATKAIATPNFAPDGLPYIALPYLVLMKLQASRSQDIADVSRMMGGVQEPNLTEVKKVIQAYLPDAIEDLESLIMLGQLERNQRRRQTF